MFARGLHEHFALVRVVRAGFLHVDVFARGNAEDRGGGVPMIRRGDGDRVNGAIFESLAEIAERGRTLEALFLDRRSSRSGFRIVHIADMGNLHVGEFGEFDRVFGSASGSSDDGDTDSAAGRLAEKNGGEGEGSGGEEGATAHAFVSTCESAR